MAPPKNSEKNSSPTAFEARVAALHTYLLGTLTAHTLKDLERQLPSVIPGITGMNAKDHIQALVNEEVLRVEKIGTGNWYWCFGSEARFQRDRLKDQALAEETSIKTRVEALQLELTGEKLIRGEEVNEEENSEREHLTSKINAISASISKLKTDLAAFEDGDPTVLQAKRDQIQIMKSAAEAWTDNCWILEGWMRAHLGIMKEDSTSLLRECYGKEYVEEEGGLKDIS